MREKKKNVNIISIHVPHLVSIFYWEIQFIDSIQGLYKMFQLNNMFNIKYETIKLNKQIYAVNRYISKMICDFIPNIHTENLFSLAEIVRQIRNKDMILFKIFVDNNKNDVVSSLNCYDNIYVIWCMIYKQSTTLQCNLMIKHSYYEKLDFQQLYVLNRISFNLNQFLKKNYILSKHCFGFFFKPKYKCSLYHMIKNCYILQYYIQNTSKKKILKGMNKYLINNQVDLGIKCFTNVINYYMGNKIIQTAEYCRIYRIGVQQFREHRLKCAFIHTYLLKSHTSSDDLYRQQELIANGIRYIIDNKTPIFLYEMIDIYKKLMIIDKSINIDQISLIYYFNYTKVHQINVGLFSHNEQNKFDFICITYIGKGSAMSFNLKLNRWSGDFMIEVPANCVVVCDC